MTASVILRDFSGKTALVTGGSRGIGRATCLRLAEEGIGVVVNYCSSDQAADEVVQTIQDHGGWAMSVKADIGNPDDIAKLVQAVVEQRGVIDILVNNAGAHTTGLFMRSKPETFEHLWRVNVDGTVRLTQLVIPMMLKSGWGRIINMSSVLSEWGGRGSSAYATAKAAINGFTLAVALEIAGKGVTCNAILPGWIETDMTSGVSEIAREEGLKRVPAKRTGLPEDIAEAVMAVVRLSYMTGETLHVDGGLRLL